MKQKSEAQLFLEQVELVETIIANKQIEKQQWRELAEGITASMDGERVQAAGEMSKMASAVNRCVDVESEIDGYVAKLVEVKNRVLHMIERLDNPTFYNILFMRYIRHMDYYEIGDAYGKDYTWATTNHGRALKEVEKLLKAERFVTVCD